MTTLDFLAKHNALPDQICAEICLEMLLSDMDLGLAGQGNIPMLPSFLSSDIDIPSDARCVVLDAGGTNLRAALARFSEDGSCHLEGLQKMPMPGTEGELSCEELYAAMAAPLQQLGCFERVGFCFSYNVTMERSLDGTLDFWCKEVQVPEAVGKPVGKSLQTALGNACRHVHVLNDSVAAMLGAGDSRDADPVGIILGTGVNVCYPEECSRISKMKEPLKANSMIISTEIGEFDKFPKSSFELAVIAASDAPANAHAEKQCSGGYLGDTLCKAWRTAAAEDLLPVPFRSADWNLADISAYLAEGTTSIPDNNTAKELASLLIARAAKIAAILCAGPMIRAAKPGRMLRVAVEGSQYWRLTGFREHFHRELDALLEYRKIQYEIVRIENACLIGAARAAFAKPM